MSTDGRIKITTDLVIDAVKMTRAVYERNAIKLASRGHFKPCLDEAKRAALMEALEADDNLCETLAGRLHQLGANT